MSENSFIAWCKLAIDEMDVQVAYYRMSYKNGQLYHCSIHVSILVGAGANWICESKGGILKKTILLCI